MLDEAFSQQRFPTVRELAGKAIDPFIKKNLSTLRRGAIAGRPDDVRRDRRQQLIGITFRSSLQ
jgi:hypothetical protein